MLVDNSIAFIMRAIEVITATINIGISCMASLYFLSKFLIVPLSLQLVEGSYASKPSPLPQLLFYSEEAVILGGTL